MRAATSPAAAAYERAEGQQEQPAAPDAPAPTAGEPTSPSTGPQPEAEREELEEFADGETEAQPLLMPGPLPYGPLTRDRATPAAQPAPPAAQPEPADEPAVADVAPRPAGVEPAPDPEPVPAKLAPPATPRKRPAPAPLPTAIAHPALAAPSTTTKRRRRRRPHLHAPNRAAWRRVGDLALLLLALTVLVLAFVALQR